MDLLEDVLERLSVYGAAKSVEFVEYNIVAKLLSPSVLHVKLIILKSEVKLYITKLLPSLMHV